MTNNNSRYTQNVEWVSVIDRYVSLSMWKKTIVLPDVERYVLTARGVSNGVSYGTDSSP